MHILGKLVKHVFTIGTTQAYGILGENTIPLPHMLAVPCQHMRVNQDTRVKVR